MLTSAIMRESRSNPLFSNRTAILGSRRKKTDFRKKRSVTFWPETTFFNDFTRWFGPRTIFFSRFFFADVDMVCLKVRQIVSETLCEQYPGHRSRFHRKPAFLWHKLHSKVRSRRIFPSQRTEICVLGTFLRLTRVAVTLHCLPSIVGGVLCPKYPFIPIFQNGTSYF